MSLVIPLEERRKASKEEEQKAKDRMAERALKGMRRMDEVEEREVEWLWGERIPLGEVTTVEGDPEAGKSWLCLAIAAELTREGKNVLYVCNEDDAETVGKKRLRILGADMERVYTYSDRATIGESVKLVLPRGTAELGMLDALVRVSHADVVFVNPLTGFLPYGTSMGKAEEMRPIFDCLAVYARSKRVSFVIVRHFAKGNENGMIGKGLGSIDIAGAARAMMYVTKHPDYNDETEQEQVRHRLVFQAKLNVDMGRPPLAFRLKKDSFEWIQTRMVSMQEAFSPQFDIFNGAEKGKIEELMSAIEAIFYSRWPDKELELGVIKSMLKVSGMDGRLLREACGRLGVRQVHQVEKGRAIKQWLKWESSAKPREGK